VAKPTRQQRRARRAEQAASAPKPVGRAPSAGGDGTVSVPSPRPEAAEPRAIPGRGMKRFLGESYAELKKVEWPSQSQVIQGTVVVLVACLIVGAYLWGADQVFQRLVQKVFLR
jgi:preprotein translocase subunit SecE